MMIKTQNQREARKKSLQLFYSTLENVLDVLNIEQRSMWLEAIYNYELFGELPSDLDPLTWAMFKVTADELDRNMDKFLETCERNKKNRNAQKDKAVASYGGGNTYPEEEPSDAATPEEIREFNNMMREKLKARDAEGS